MVESLTSYVIRVAAAHCVTLGTLVAAEIAPIINKGYLTQKKSGTISSAFCCTAGIVNSYGITATEWVTAMQVLTLRQELRFLTIVGWNELFAKNLVRKCRAWCPGCYEEWRQKGKPIYDPLLWSLRAVTACPIHKRLLRDKCVLCSKQPFHLSPNVRPGYCPGCEQWLGASLVDAPAENELLSDEQLRWQSWVAKHLGALFAALPRSPSLPKKEIVADLASACIQRLTRGNLNALVYRFSSFSSRAIKQWSQGYGRPELARILQLCYVAEIPLSDILIGVVNITSYLQQDIPTRTLNYGPVSVAELNKMEITIHGMLEEYPPPSMLEASTRLGCHYLTFKKYFPTQHQQIKERHSAYRGERYDRKKISYTLLSARDEFPPPSVTSIAKRLGCSPSFLRFLSRDDCHIISVRHNEFRKAFTDPADTLIKLHALQTEFPPKPIGECAKELGCCSATLTKYFPDETRAIKIKYSNYYQKEAKQRKSSRRNIILAAATALIAEQTPLTLHRIKTRLPDMKCLINREIDQVLKEMRSELYIVVPE
jgi:AraC-like DNA-binding protein